MKEEYEYMWQFYMKDLQDLEKFISKAQLTEAQQNNFRKYLKSKDFFSIIGIKEQLLQNFDDYQQ